VLVEASRKLNVAFLSTCLPRECGLATFTKDLADALSQIRDFNPPVAVAMNDNETHRYGSHVIGQISQHDQAEYRKAAFMLNQSNVDLLVIQHEFGIYGGESGEYVLELAHRVKMPLIVVFHTVLTKPTPKQRLIVNQLGKLSFKVITMAQSTVEDLISIYGIEPHKVEMLHHGVPTVLTETRDALKERYGLTGRAILSTFGFLSPGKGIEYAIDALAGVAARHPEVLYRILGKTHPVVKREFGEVYRRKLVDQAAQLHLEGNIQFIDKLLTQEEIVQALVLSDIYITPYLGQDQAVSGTLAYGVGYGRVIISTPYRYAKEMLANGRGLLTDFHDSASLETSILQVLDEPERKTQMETQTLSLGRTMMWNEVAKQYASLVRKVAGSSHAQTGSAS
ncbi:MAG: glycosyltransferase family 4 protein, partial [Sulfobacillus sp.]